MNTTVKKAAPKKKVGQQSQTKIMIKYTDARLKPKDGCTVHSIYLNNPDKLQVFPKQMFEIHTGLEIDVLKNMVLVTHLNLVSAVQIGGMHFGYQKELIIIGYNLSDSMIELDPYQIVGSIHLSEIKPFNINQ